MKSQALIVCWFIHLSECIASGPASSPRALSVRLVIHNTFIYLPTPSDSQHHWGIYCAPPPQRAPSSPIPSPTLPHLINSGFFFLSFWVACKMKWLWRQLSLGSSKINMSMPEEVGARLRVWLRSECREIFSSVLSVAFLRRTVASFSPFD